MKLKLFTLAFCSAMSCSALMSMDNGERKGAEQEQPKIEYKTIYEALHGIAHKPNHHLWYNESGTYSYYVGLARGSEEHEQLSTELPNNATALPLDSSHFSYLDTARLTKKIHIF